MFGARREIIHCSLHSVRVYSWETFLLLHLLLSEKQMLSKMSPPTFYTLLFNDSHKANIFTALLAGGIELNRIALNWIVQFIYFFSQIIETSGHDLILEV